jgi:hypothetical protein
MSGIVLDVRWKGLKVELRVEGVVSTSRGLVGDTVFAVLPNIEPGHTFVLTLLCQGVRHLFRVHSAWTIALILSICLRLPAKKGLPRKTLDGSDLQKFPGCTDAVRMVIVHVWVACS